MKVVCAGTEIELLAGRAVFWPEKQTLLIADTHLGKADHFRAAGLPVPRTMNVASLDRLASLVNSTHACRLIVLGDFWHAPSGVSDELLESIGNWQNQFRSLEVDLVLGNHDRGCGELPKDWDIAIHKEPLVVSPFVFSHYPQSHAEGYTLAGHLHPAIAVRGKGREMLKLPCFWLGAEVGVLPAFGAFTGTAVVRPKAADRVFAIADDEVVDLSAGLRAND